MQTRAGNSACRRLRGRVHAGFCGEETLTSQLMTKRLHPSWNEFGFQIIAMDQVGGLFALAILLDPIGYFNFAIIELAEE